MNNNMGKKYIFFILIAFLFLSNFNNVSATWYSPSQNNFVYCQIPYIGDCIFDTNNFDNNGFGNNNQFFYMTSKWNDGFNPDFWGTTIFKANDPENYGLEVYNIRRFPAYDYGLGNLSSFIFSMDNEGTDAYVSFTDDRTKLSHYEVNNTDDSKWTYLEQTSSILESSYDHSVSNYGNYIAWSSFGTTTGRIIVIDKTFTNLLLNYSISGIKLGAPSFSRNGNYIYSKTFTGNKLIVINTTSWTNDYNISLSFNSPNARAVDDGFYIYTLGTDNTIYKYSINNGTLINSVTSLCSSQVIGASYDNTLICGNTTQINVYNSATLSLLGTYNITNYETGFTSSDYTISVKNKIIFSSDNKWLLYPLVNTGSAIDIYLQFYNTNPSGALGIFGVTGSSGSGGDIGSGGGTLVSPSFNNIINNLINIFPDADNLSFGRKILYVVFTLVFVTSLMFFMGWILISGGKTSNTNVAGMKFIIYITGFIDVLLFFYFISINYIPVGILVIGTLILIALAYFKFFGGGSGG